MVAQNPLGVLAWVLKYTQLPRRGDTNCGQHHCDQSSGRPAKVDPGVRGSGPSGVRGFGPSGVRGSGPSGVRGFGPSGVRGLGPSGVRPLGCPGARPRGGSGVRPLGGPGVRRAAGGPRVRSRRLSPKVERSSAVGLQSSPGGAVMQQSSPPGACTGKQMQ